MSAKLQAIRGMNDILPGETKSWQQVEAVLANCLMRYGYNEIRLPIMEKTEVFSRGVGVGTDIVDKEMYSFADRNGDNLTLRPEGTAGCVRAVLEHGLNYNQVQKLWYLGPMFRHERPQKGRYRQFWQLGVECFGVATPDIDAELIALTADFWRQLGISANVSLEINTLGTSSERAAYKASLVAYFTEHKSQLDADSIIRLDKNPLRILDSKNPAMQDLIAAAPKLADSLGEDSKQYFASFKIYLDSLGIKYRVNPYLVRGLDYYSQVVFEWVTDELGAQSAVCAGGRYDGLIELFGGKPSPAIGFAMGLDRLMLLLQAKAKLSAEATQADIYILVHGELAQSQALSFSDKLRRAKPDSKIILHCGGGSLKSQFKKADKSGAGLAIILADDELEQGKVSLKYLREDKPQELIEINDIL